MKHASCNITFVGDFFSLTHFVEIDLEEPSFANMDNDQLEEVAVDMATKNLRYHYGWEMKDISWETTVEFDYLPEL